MSGHTLPLRARVARVMAVALVAGSLLTACGGPDDLPPGGLPPSPARSSAGPGASLPVPFPPPGKVFLGLQTNFGPFDLAPVDAFSSATHHQPSALQFSQGWATDQFNPTMFDRAVARGMLPILSWEPWDYRARSSGQQPNYRLSAITSGVYDTYIRSWAQGIAALPYPVVVRFGHEMNGFWYPWCEQSNSNHQGDYVKTWRHVHDIFTASGALNVTWLWSPNVTYAGSAPLRNLYPGDDFVDWIGLSGYYGTAGHEQYRSFDSIFNATLAELKTFTSRPIVVTETAATNSTGQQARWISEMFAQLPHHPEVIGVIWFETVKEIDWRIAPVPASAAAFATGAAAARYDTPWQPKDTPWNSQPN